MPPVFPVCRPPRCRAGASWAWTRRRSWEPWMPTTSLPATFDHTALDDCRTRAWSRPRHWARPIDTAPFFGYALRSRITFTYLGLKVDETAAVRFGGRPSDNLFVAGEMMAGNVLGRLYRRSGHVHRDSLRPSPEPGPRRHAIEWRSSCSSLKTWSATRCQAPPGSPCVGTARSWARKRPKWRGSCRSAMPAAIARDSVRCFRP